MKKENGVTEIVDELSKNGVAEILIKLLKDLLKISKDNECQVKYKKVSKPGYLFKIPLQEGKSLFPVLITGLLPFKNFSIENKKIEISFKNKEHFVFLNSRICYINLDYDIIVFQIKEDDDYLYSNNLMQLNLDLFKAENDLLNKKISLAPDAFDIIFAYCFSNIIRSEEKQNSHKFGEFILMNILENSYNFTEILNGKNEEKTIGMWIESTFTRFSEKLMKMIINNLQKVNNSDKSNTFKGCSGAKTLNYSEESYNRYFGLTDNILKTEISNIGKSNTSFTESNDSIKDYFLLKNNNNYDIKNINEIEDSFSGKTIRISSKPIN